MARAKPALVAESEEIEPLEADADVRAAQARLTKVQTDLSTVERKIAELQSQRGGDVDDEARVYLETGVLPVTDLGQLARLRRQRDGLKRAVGIVEAQLTDAVCAAFRARYERHKAEHLRLIQEVCDNLEQVKLAVEREQQFRDRLRALAPNQVFEIAKMNWATADALRRALLLLNPDEFRHRQQERNLRR